MARDYAKRYKTQPKKRKKSATLMYLRSAFVLLVVFLVIAAGGAGYYQYRSMKKPTTEQASLLPPVSNAEETALKTKTPAPVAEAKEEAVDYEFYTLLRKINVPDPVQINTPAGEQPGFWLQMAVYYSMRDASAMVDRLQLLGLDPAIAERKSTKADRTLYVVIMGPYSTKELAATRQQELKKINVTSYIFHVDTPIPTTTPITQAPEPNAATSASSVPVISATPVDLSA